MEKVNVELDKETYNHLVALGVIKEEPTTNDPHKGFVVGKKYKHQDGAIAYYCGINNNGYECWELVTANCGMNIFAGSIPKGWISKASNKYWLISHDRFDPTPIEEGVQPFEGTKWVRIERSAKPIYWYADKIGKIFEVEYSTKLDYNTVKRIGFISYGDCTEVEAPVKELKPWEKFSTLESCWEKHEQMWNVDSLGEVYDTLYSDYYHYSTEAEAKKARATIFLSRIAKKWNEGVDDTGTYYFPLKNGENIKVDWFGGSSYLGNALPFKFNSAELAEKSLELFPDVWKDFYGR